MRSRRETNPARGMVTGTISRSLVDHAPTPCGHRGTNAVDLIIHSA